MILNDSEALHRLTSGNNLMNMDLTRSRGKAMGLFGVGSVEDREVEPKIVEKTEELKKPSFLPSFDTVVSEAVAPQRFNPFNDKAIEVREPEILPVDDQTKIDDVLDNVDARVNLALAHDKALSLLTKSLTELEGKVSVIKADKLASVITATAKVVEGIRRERNEHNKNSKGQEVHYHFYTPVQKAISDYQVVEA